MKYPKIKGFLLGMFMGAGVIGALSRDLPFMLLAVAGCATVISWMLEP